MGFLWGPCGLSFSLCVCCVIINASLRSGFRVVMSVTQRKYFILELRFSSLMLRHR